MGTAEDPGSGTAGVGARGAVLVALALILGVVLLNKFDSGPTPFSEQVDTDNGPSTTLELPIIPEQPATTARQARAPADVKVLPANGTGAPRLGARTGEFLRTANYNALAPVDSTRAVETTIVAHKPGFEAEARVLAQLLQVPLSAVRPIDENTPVPETRDADVVVVAGSDARIP